MSFIQNRGEAEFLQGKTAHVYGKSIWYGGPFRSEGSRPGCIPGGILVYSTNPKVHFQVRAPSIRLIAS